MKEEVQSQLLSGQKVEKGEKWMEQSMEPMKMF